MFFFWRFILAHLMGDFPLQPAEIVKWKQTRLSGVVAHCVIHFFCYMLVNLPYISRPEVWYCSLAITLTHIAQDYWRVVSIKRWGTPDNMWFLLADQVIHYFAIFCYLIIFGLYDPPWLARPQFIETPVLMACLLIVATFFTSVFVFYVNIGWGDRPHAAKVFDDEHLYGIAERFLVMNGLVFLPVTAWAFIPAVWLGRLLTTRWRRRFDFTPANLLVGNLIAVACGIAGRLL